MFNKRREMCWGSGSEQLSVKGEGKGTVRDDSQVSGRGSGDAIN